MADRKGLPIREFASRSEWDAWLHQHADRSAGVWLKFAKVASGVVTVGKAEAIATALAHGWIDGQIDRFDERYWLIRFTPRRPKSKWSRLNRETAERLIAEGMMFARGMIEVQSAQRDGRWETAYEPQSTATVPDDFRDALDRHPRAKAFFATVSGANRYAILYRIADAKTAKTRAERIDKFIAMLEAGHVLHEPRTRKPNPQ